MSEAKELEPADFEQTLDEEKRKFSNRSSPSMKTTGLKIVRFGWQDYLPEDSQLRACLVAELPEIEAEFLVERVSETRF